MLPVLSNAKKRARQTQCASNQHQIGLGWMMYVEDNGQILPVLRGWGAAGGQKGDYAVDNSVAYAFGVSVDYTNRRLTSMCRQF